MPTILRPLSTSELLDRTFSLYRKHFALFVGIVGLPYLVWLAVQLAGVVLVPVQIRGPVPVQTGGGVTGALWPLLNGLVSLLVLAASQAATVIAVSSVYLDRPTSVTSAYARIKRRIVPVMLIMLAVLLGIGIGLVLLIVPGVIFALMWSLTVPVAVIEKKGLNAATLRSRQLTKGVRGRIFVICVVFIALSWAVNALWQLPLGVIVALTASGRIAVAFGWVRVLSALGTFVSQCLVGPLLTIALSLVYYDQRVRKEAFDLDVMMSALEGASPRAAMAIPAQ